MPRPQRVFWGGENLLNNKSAGVTFAEKKSWLKGNSRNLCAISYLVNFCFWDEELFLQLTFAINKKNYYCKFVSLLFLRRAGLRPGNIRGSSRWGSRPGNSYGNSRRNQRERRWVWCKFLRFKARVGFKVKLEVMEGGREQGTRKTTAESEDSTENISQNVWETYAIRNSNAGCDEQTKSCKFQQMERR